MSTVPEQCIGCCNNVKVKYGTQVSFIGNRHDSFKIYRK